jgi:hypothetical protein
VFEIVFAPVGRVGKRELVEVNRTSLWLLSYPYFPGDIVCDPPVKSVPFAETVKLVVVAIVNILGSGNKNDPTVPRNAPRNATICSASLCTINGDKVTSKLNHDP